MNGFPCSVPTSGLVPAVPNSWWMLPAAACRATGGAVRAGSGLVEDGAHSWLSRLDGVSSDADG